MPKILEISITYKIPLIWKIVLIIRDTTDPASWLHKTAASAFIHWGWVEMNCGTGWNRVKVSKYA